MAAFLVDPWASWPQLASVPFCFRKTEREELEASSGQTFRSITEKKHASPLLRKKLLLSSFLGCISTLYCCHFSLHTFASLIVSKLWKSKLYIPKSGTMAQTYKSQCSHTQSNNILTSRPSWAILALVQNSRSSNNKLLDMIIRLVTPSCCDRIPWPYVAYRRIYFGLWFQSTHNGNRQPEQEADRLHLKHTKETMRTRTGSKVKL